MRCLPLAVAAALLGGCAAGVRPPTHVTTGERPDLAARPWTTFTTPHVELWTEADPAASRRLAARLERLHLSLAAALGGPGAPPGRVRVVLLPARADLAGLAGGGVAGLLTTRAEEPTAVADAATALADPAVVAHELAHHLVERLLVRPPPWLAEGLAEALETAAEPGASPAAPAWPRWVRAGWRPAPGFVRALARWDGEPDPAAPRRDIDAAWALTRFLLEAEPDRLGAWLRRLAAGQEAAWAFGAVFPEWAPEAFLGPDRLEARVVAFLEARARRAPTPPATPAAGADAAGVEVAVRPADPADARLLLLELPRRVRQPPEALRAEVLAALRDAPDHPLALRWLAQLDRLDPLPLALRAVEAHPEDWRSWSFLATAAATDDEDAEAREAALRRAAELAPRRAAALRALASHLVDLDRLEEALPFAWQALEQRPWDRAVLETYAAAAVGVGACPVAPEAAARLGPTAAAVEASSLPDPELLARLRGLARLERRCDLARFAESAFAERAASAGPAAGP